MARDIKPLTRTKFIAIESDSESFLNLTSNIAMMENVNLPKSVITIKKPFTEVNLTALPNFFITNAPYGLKGDKENKVFEATDELIALYRALGQFMKQQCAPPGKAFVVTANMKLSKQVGLLTKARHEITISGMDSRMLEFDIV